MHVFPVGAEGVQLEQPVRCRIVLHHLEIGAGVYGPRAGCTDTFKLVMPIAVILHQDPHDQPGATIMCQLPLFGANGHAHHRIRISTGGAKNFHPSPENLPAAHV